MNESIRELLDTRNDHSTFLDWEDGEHVEYIKGRLNEKLILDCIWLGVNVLDGICGSGKWGASQTAINGFDFVPSKPYPWTSRQYAATVRARYDRPIIGARRILDLCTIESIKRNKTNLINYFTTCYDWIDLPVALYIYNTLIKPDKERELQITFEESQNSEQSTIRFGKATTYNTLQWYLSQNWHYIKPTTRQHKKYKASQITVFTVRNIIVNFLTLYDIKISAKELLGILEYCFKIDRLPFLTDTYFDTEVWKDISRFRKQFKKDWFHDVILQFSQETKQDIMGIFYEGKNFHNVVACMGKKHKNLDYLALLCKIPTVFHNNQKIQEFELSFENQRFKLIKV